jgi:hypothetical protein
MSDAPFRFSDDLRAELQSAAISAQRASRPRWLLWLGAMAVLAGLGVVIFGITRRAAASAALDDEVRLNQRLAQATSELRAAGQFEADLGGPAALAPDARMLGKIAQAARDAGLTVASESESDDTRPTPAGLKRKQYLLSFTGQPSEQLFAWLKNVTAEHKTLQVRRLSLRPSEAAPSGEAGWKLDIVFTRWERSTP